jgi:hypothetical protein
MPETGTAKTVKYGLKRLRDQQQISAVHWSVKAGVD